MKYETKIFKEHNLVVDVVEGEVTVEELTDKFFSLFNHPDYDESMRGICDLRKATSRMNRSDFDQLTAKVNKASDFGKARWAIITEDSTLTAFAMIFEHRVGKRGNIEIFSTMRAAENYIGVPLSEVPL